MVAVPERLEDRTRTYELFISAQPRISDEEKRLVHVYGRDFLTENYDIWKIGLYRRAHMIDEKTNPIDLAVATIIEDTPVDDDTTIIEEITRIGGGMLITEIERLYKGLFAGLNKVNRYKRRVNLALVVLSRALIRSYLDKEEP